MPSVPTTRAGLNQGYDLGENGWKTGMDDNFTGLDTLVPSDFGIRTISGLVITLLGGALTTTTTATGSTVTLTASTTYFVQRSTAGSIIASTASFSAANVALYKIVTGSTAVSAATDVRYITGAAGGGGSVGTGTASHLAYWSATSSIGDIELQFGATAGPFSTPAVSPTTDGVWNLGLVTFEFAKIWTNDLRHRHASNPLRLFNELAGGIDFGVSGAAVASLRIGALGGGLLTLTEGVEFISGGLQLRATDGATLDLYSGLRSKVLFEFADTGTTTAQFRFGPPAQSATYQVTFFFTDALGTNVAPAAATIATPRATGNATSPGIVFQSGITGASGTSLQTLTARLKLISAASGAAALDFIGTDGAAGSTSLLTNAPTANTVKWIPVLFNGAAGHVPFVPD